MSTELVLRQADYSLSDEQEAVRDAFASFFERECPTTRVRAAEPGGFDDALWRRLVDMRAVAMGVPESVGGDGAGLVELGLVAEELGRRLAPVPLIEAVVAARTLARLTGPAAAGPLAEIIDGASILTVALHAGAGPQLVPGAAVAGGVIGLVGDDLVLTRTPEPPRRPANQGHAPIAWCELAGSATSSVTVASGAEARQAFERARREWKLLMAWASVGMAAAVLDISVEHARSRVAFGAPIGTYQAISHPLADVAMDVDTGRRLVGKASWYAEYEPDVNRHLAPMAYVYCVEAAMKAATVGVHVLGGVGFTVESDAQLYFRRVKGWTLVAGELHSDVAEIADHLFGPTGPSAR